MKGQYKIVVEIMLFAIGLSITSYVILSFGNVQRSVENVTTVDNMDVVGDVIINGIIKASQIGNSTVKLTIPEQISTSNYEVNIENDELTISSIQNPSIFIKRQIFNISQIYSISNRSIASAAKFVEIKSDGTNIWIKRWERP
jgi:hypothetical protein